MRGVDVVNLFGLDAGRVWGGFHDEYEGVAGGVIGPEEGHVAKELRSNVDRGGGGVGGESLCLLANAASRAGCGRTIGGGRGGGLGGSASRSSVGGRAFSHRSGGVGDARGR